MTRRIRAFHPFLFAILPILAVYSRNLHAVGFSATIVPATISLLAALGFWSCLRVCRLDGLQAALVTSSAMILFFSFGLAVRMFGRIGIGSTPLTREWITIGIDSLAFICLVVMVLKKPGLVPGLSRFLDASSIALLVFSMIGITSRLSEDLADRPPVFATRPAPILTPARVPSPDVYFLILDAYGRSDALREVVGFDDSAFLSRLETQGFVVANRSTSNYCQTALSVSATLNLGYLDEAAGSGSKDRLPLKGLIADSAVVRAFRAEGYRIVTFDSGFDATESVAADLTLGPTGDLGTFPSIVADQTPLSLILGSEPGHRAHQMHRRRILKVFEELPVSRHPADGPTFTFAHILAPHPPFDFAADGSDTSAREGAYSLNDVRFEGEAGAREYARRYREQAEYLDRRVEEAVCRILESSTVEPIIIIQGDHGSGSRFNAESAAPNDLFERMTVLNAIHLPKRFRGEIDPSISLVNTFRFVFDRCFGTKLGLLEDRNFYSTYSKPYDFIEVTGKVNR